MHDRAPALQSQLRHLPIEMKAVLIDDEARARQLLRAMLTDHCPQVQVLAECDDLPTGVKAIRKHKPDLVFLDVEMPGHSGLELPEFFSDADLTFQVILTTAYDQYAIQAFKLPAVGYLLKPLSPSDLREAVAMAEKRAKAAQTTDPSPMAISSVPRLAVPQVSGTRFVPQDQIMFLKGDRAYTELHLRDGSTLVASRNLGHFEAELNGNPLFFRSHRSYIINLNEVKELVKGEGGYLKLNAGHEVSIALDRMDELVKRLSHQ